MADRRFICPNSHASRSWANGATAPRNPAPPCAALSSDRGERAMRFGRQLDVDRVARTYLAAGKDYPHDAGFAHKVAAVVACQGCRHQTRLDAVKLRARVAQPGDL